MSRLGRSISSEWRKITATKTWWTLAIVMALYVAMMAVTMAFMFTQMSELNGIPAPENSAALSYSTTATLGYVIPLVFGALAATNELRHQTLGVTYAIEPRRGIVFAGKTIGLLAIGVIIGIFGILGAAGAAAPVLAYGDVSPGLTDGATWALLARIVLVLAIWAVIGFGVGLIVKNQAFAIVLAIGFTQLVEPVARIGAQFWDWAAAAAKYLPGAAMDAFVGESVLTGLGATDPSLPEVFDSLSQGAGFAVLVVYAVVACIIGWILRLRADVA